MVTDTAMVKKDGQVLAFEPVVRELLFFLKVFDTITWIGFNYPGLRDNPTMIPVPRKVNCILLKPTGGHSFFKKIKVLINAPFVFWIILMNIRGTNMIHTRAPSSPAFLAVLLSIFFKRKIWWNKYAGNWGQKKPPFFYKLQRMLLKRAVWTKVTINGKWPDQEPHCLSFENPCLTNEELNSALDFAKTKRFNNQLVFLFVGRIEIEKGAERIINAFKLIPDIRYHVAKMIFVGTGKDASLIHKKANECPVPCHFTGVLGRRDLDKYYQKSHILILPSSASEGFPKVIAEAAAFGCVPLVSDISSIGQYVKHEENGYLIKEITPKAIAKDIIQLVQDRGKLRNIALGATKIAENFTYSWYLHRINTEIIQKAVVSQMGCFSIFVAKKR